MACNTIVIVREVWDTRDLTGNVLDEDGKIKTDTLLTRFEPEDLNALEMALSIKDEQGGNVTAISLGKTKQVDVLRECLYRGTDQVVRINTDLSELDTQSAAKLIAEAIKKQEAYDLILVGVTLTDGENSMLGSHVAALLGIEQLSFVDGIEEIGDGKVTGKRAIEMGYEDIEALTPALLSVGVALTEDDPRTPRSAKAMLKLKAKKTEIPALSQEDLGGVAGQTLVAGHTAVEERTIDSKDVDPEDESALQTMLETALKGE